MPFDTMGQLFHGPSLTGKGCSFGLDHGSRYLRFDRRQMMDQDLYATVSSAVVYGSYVANPTLILFMIPKGWPQWKQVFRGPFVQISNRKNSGRQYAINHLGAYNKHSSSMLFIPTRRKEEYRVSVRDMALAEWNAVIDDMLKDSGSYREGDPWITWRMWPQRQQYLDPDRCYVSIHQDLHIAVPYWADYKASVAYDIYLYLERGYPQGWVTRWYIWVEAGPKAEKIGNRLRPKVIRGGRSLNERLAYKIHDLPPIGFGDLYFLPGHQVYAPRTGTIVSDIGVRDVTVVLEHK